jgi:hypothetical protein
MPCISGRAIHQLCKNDCPENACDCQVPAGFSCRPYCFCEARTDKETHNRLLTLNDARQEICDHIQNSIENCPPPYATVGDFANAICAVAPTGCGPVPAFNCPFEIYISGSALGDGVSGPTGAAAGPFLATTVNNGQCTPSADAGEALAQGDGTFYDVSVDRFDCVQFNNSDSA